jgi:hypothetical protein
MSIELIFNEEKHEYSVSGRVIPSVTQIISSVGLYEFDYVSKQTLRIAAERGRIVHTYIEWYEQGILDESSIDPELAGYFQAYLAMKKQHNFSKPESLEKRVYSRLGYAGTLDMLLDGGTWIHDHKTGVKSPTHGLQLSAYWLAEHPNTADKPFKLTCGYYRQDGSFELVEYPYEPLIWIAVLTDYNWRKKHNLIKEIWK